MVDVANGSDVDMRFLPLELAAGSTDSESASATGIGGKESWEEGGGEAGGG